MHRLSGKYVLQLYLQQFKPLSSNNIIYLKCLFLLNNCMLIQVLKLQETPESIPQGELPRHLTVYCERTLCEKVAPGARVVVLGIYSIKKIAKFGVSILNLFR